MLKIKLKLESEVYATLCAVAVMGAFFVFALYIAPLPSYPPVPLQSPASLIGRSGVSKLGQINDGDTAHESFWDRTSHDPVAFYTFILAAFTGVAAVGSLLGTVILLRKAQRQLEQASATVLTSISNQHNWDLFKLREKMPPALPAWDGLDEQGWAWRVLHLNHLNLLKLAKDDHSRGLMKDPELRAWIVKARYWFSNLKADERCSKFHKGRVSLKQLLQNEEGYPAEFRVWLREQGIVADDLLPKGLQKLRENEFE